MGSSYSLDRRPRRSVVSKLIAKFAFFPPPPTYTVHSSGLNSSLKWVLKPEACFSLPVECLDDFVVLRKKTERNSDIICVYLSCTGDRRIPNFDEFLTIPDDQSFAGAQQDKLVNGLNRTRPLTLLYSHGNSVDLGQMADLLLYMCYRFNVNVLCYDYSGYGASSGDSSEENLYADAETALRVLLDDFRVPSEEIVLFGHSLGTAATVELAAKYRVAGVVLQSPLMSGLRVIWPKMTRSLPCDAFRTMDKVGRVESPTLIMHGTADRVISVAHGRELFARLRHPLQPAWIEDAGHNDMHEFAEYEARLERFFNSELR